MKCPYKVSILVPVYRVEKYIGFCAKSIFAQTYKDLEIIFVDDFTDDASVEVIRQTLRDFPQRASQVHVIQHKKNRGTAAAHNTAVGAATGEFVYHLDGDDWIEQNTIEEMASQQLKTKSDIVSAKFVINEKETDPHYLEPNYPSKDAMLSDILSQQWHHEVAGRFIRRTLYTDNDVACIEGCNMAEDWHVTPMLLWYANNIAFIDKPFYHYRRNPNSMVNARKSPTKLLKSMVEAYRNISSLYDFFKNKNERYADKVTHLCAPMCYQLLMLTVATKNKPQYDVFRKEMLRYPRHLKQKHLGVSHYVILHLPFNYHIELLRHAIGMRLHDK